MAVFPNHFTMKDGRKTYVNLVYFLQVMVDDSTILNKGSVSFKTTTVLFDMVGEFYQAALNCGSIYRSSC